MNAKPAVVSIDHPRFMSPQHEAFPPQFATYSGKGRPAVSGRNHGMKRPTA